MQTSLLFWLNKWNYDDNSLVLMISWSTASSKHAPMTVNHTLPLPFWLLLPQKIMLLGYRLTRIEQLKTHIYVFSVLLLKNAKGSIYAHTHVNNTRWCNGAASDQQLRVLILSNVLLHIRRWSSFVQNQSPKLLQSPTAESKAVDCTVCFC